MTTSTACKSTMMKAEILFTARSIGSVINMESSSCLRKVRRSKITISGMALWNNNCRNPVLLFLWFGCLSLNAQTTSEVEKNIRATYPDRSAVFVEQSATLTLSIEGDSLKAYSDV